MKVHYTHTYTHIHVYIIYCRSLGNFDSMAFLNKNILLSKMKALILLRAFTKRKKNKSKNAVAMNVYMCKYFPLTFSSHIKLNRARYKSERN